MTSPNKKTFNLSLARTAAFNLVIYGIAVVDTILMNLRQKTVLTFTLTLTGKLITTIRSKVRITISQVKLTTKLVQTINARRIKLTYIMKLIGKIATDLDIRNSIRFISSARQKLLTTLDSKLSISWNPLIATFYALSVHDGKDLSVMDTEDLADLDYTV